MWLSFKNLCFEVLFLLCMQLVNPDSFTVQTLINRANQETNTCGARVESMSAIVIHWSNSVGRDRQCSNVDVTWMKCAVSYCLLSLSLSDGSFFIRLAVIASKTLEMPRNSKRFWPYSSSRSSKVIHLGVSGKPICDFLLVINCNFSRICYHFRDRKLLILLTPPVFNAP